LVTKRSQFDHQIVQREISQYQRLKQTLYNNKKALSPSRRGITALLPHHPRPTLYPEDTPKILGKDGPFQPYEQRLASLE
jgi:hypothetical protein